MIQDKTDAIIVAAGSGSRLGYSLPKAFVPLGEKPLLYYSVLKYTSHPSVSSVILVVSSSMLESANAFLEDHPQFKNSTIITEGGDERWKSVRNGVHVSQAEWVLIHDAARPFITDEVIDSVIQKRECYDSVITATPEVDTIRTFRGDIMGTTLDRSQVVRVGTPQLFRRTLLSESFSEPSLMDPPPTDEAALMERKGVTIGFAWGDPLNFKITTPSDMQIAEALIERDKKMFMGR
ncbi:2-C-methyl-D-erythritol 4-phosphate cytidylyltransferase [Chitinispirillales bacterium ANBcel5]|uniref:2-C-methyl-D-erythritol 4-phosphate cytidylyltransferase n=1 Tax=Cellulosispirillum alkaliphilum TaxID=3039283 RepID=UPI002A58608D|nr:2-C-methyl-D-erythritol 4-phosphate cytidylyltransferase [Chitinispirillales bacterium ANBcel5]